MQLSDFLKIIEKLTGSPVKITQKQDIPPVLESIEIFGIEEREKELLKDCYFFDDELKKYCLKPKMPLDKKIEILKLFNRIKNDKPTLDEALIEDIISQGNKSFDRNQFNELLLLCNKDRISEGFFNFFFRDKKKEPKTITLNIIAKKVECFQKYAMLAFGNFMFAYRKLSKMSYGQIESELYQYIVNPKEKEKIFLERPEKVQEIQEIKANDTYLIGYLSGTEIELDSIVSKQLKESIRTFSGTIWGEFKTHTKLHWKDNLGVKYEQLLDAIEKRILKILEYFERYGSKDINEFKAFIYNAALEIEKLDKQRHEVLSIGEKNNQIYLTWDYMDVYLATSMRTKWEYEDFCKLAKELFEKNEEVKKLKLRYFNPVQSYEKSTVDKGLVEGLMLKRADCTIYSIQESDTLGKDSELATTLVQGKPVIAFVKEINNISERAGEFKEMPLEFFRDRVKLLEKEGLFQENKVVKEYQAWFKECDTKIKEIKESPEKFIFNFTDEIIELIDKKVWSSINTPWVDEEKFKEKNSEKFKYYCDFIAITEKYFYNKRADTVSKIHPLRLQIDLKTGVANGILVVRSYEQCSQLLKNIITNKLYFDLEFNLRYNKDEKCWTLVEPISNCIYRVVTDNVKVTNSFWNFYLEKEKKEKKKEDEDEKQE